MNSCKYKVSHKLREPYKNCEKKIYSNFDSSVFSFDYYFDMNSDCQTVINVINECKENDKSRVWLLFAGENDDQLECVQVAQSKNKAESEVKTAINYIFDIYNPTEKFENSQFYENVCPKLQNKDQYRRYLYSMIGSKYSSFRICYLNVDKYLGIVDDNAYDNKSDAEKIVEICKNQYAEAKIAYETLALYWRSYSSGIDGQTISYIVEHSYKR